MAPLPPAISVIDRDVGVVAADHDPVEVDVVVPVPAVMVVVMPVVAPPG
jgi:hypothetical protein